MGDAALNLAVPAPHTATDWPLRLAQQAFAQVIEAPAALDRFAASGRRQAARQALSALSVDDRGPLERWLALQLVTAAAERARDALASLAGVDALLTAAVRAQLARTAAAFSRAGGRLQPVA